MADGPWTKYQAAPAEDGPWAKYAQPKTEALTPPDATAQARAAIRKPIDSQLETQPLTGHGYGGGTTFLTGTPEQLQPAREAQKNMAITGAAAAGGEAIAPLAAGAEGFAGGSRMLKFLFPALTRALGVGTGAAAGEGVTGGSAKDALKTGAEAAALSVAGEALLKGGGAAVKALSSKVNPLAKINKILGVTAKEVIPGKTPASLDDFSANPARGVLKAGLDEKALTKMNPMERNTAVMAAKDKTGAELDKVLQAAGDKKVDIMPTIKKTFEGILDPKLGKQAETRLMQILQKAGITKPLSQLTPMEARTVQRSLDDFANFASEGEAKSFRDIARQIRKGISAETRKVVPESAPLDQDYTDLVNAAKATQKSLKSYAKTVPENKLRSMIKKAAIGTGVAGAGYEAYKHISNPLP